MPRCTVHLPVVCCFKKQFETIPVLQFPPGVGPKKSLPPQQDLKQWPLVSWCGQSHGDMPAGKGGGGGGFGGVCTNLQSELANWISLGNWASFSRKTHLIFHPPSEVSKRIKRGGHDCLLLAAKGLTGVHGTSLNLGLPRQIWPSCLALV